MYLSADNAGDHRAYDSGDARASVPVRLETLGVLLFGQQQERRRVRILKSDTQGYEPFVLRGAERFIARDASTILLEYWPSGYAPARADGVGMLRTLRVWYPHAYVIEGDALQPVDPLTIDDFLKLPGQAKGHRNLLFSKNPIDYGGEISYN